MLSHRHLGDALQRSGFSAADARVHYNNALRAMRRALPGGVNGSGSGTDDACLTAVEGAEASSMCRAVAAERARVDTHEVALAIVAVTSSAKVSASPGVQLLAAWQRHAVRVAVPD